MTTSAHHNGQNPTDPYQAMALAILFMWAATHLNTDQANAIAAMGGIAELALYALRLIQGRR